jgi:membrane-associated phospholipid phosphatase
MTLLYESIYTFFRSFSFFAVIFSLAGGLLLSKWNYFLLGLFLIAEITINMILKKIFETLMGNYNFPIIGRGTRPYNFKSCGYFTPRLKNKLLDNGIASFGMPSGHSQSFAFIATLISLHFKNNFKTLILVFLTCIAMYMRVYIEKCHTISQTIIGALIGVGLAHLFVKYYTNPFDV